MSVLSETALTQLRASVAGLLAAEENTDREIELLGREEERDDAGQRVLGENEVLRSYTGIVQLDSAGIRRAADRPVGERTATVILPYDADLSGVSGFRIAGTDTVWAPLNGDDNLDTSYRVTTEVRVKETRL